MRQNILLLGALIVVVALVLNQAFLAIPTASAETQPLTANLADDTDSDNLRTLTVSSEYTVSASPTKAEIWFSVETLALNAQASQQQNATLTQKVMDALKASGIASKDIETSSYSLYERNEWNSRTQEQEFKGYQTVNSLKVTVRDLTKAGKTIDVAITAGSNRVSSIVFTVEDNQLEQLKMQALTQAGELAQQKAQAIATGLKIQLDGIQTVSENSSNYYPYQPQFRYNAAGAMDSAAPETPISAGDIKITANLSVTYKIK